MGTTVDSRQSIVRYFIFRYLPPFLNKSGIYYATSRNGCYCSKSKSNCQHLNDKQSYQSDFIKLNHQEDDDRRMRGSGKNFTEQRQLYEDIRERRSKRSSRRASSSYQSSEEWSDNAILDSELDIDTVYELCEFRERNADECMSASNRLRYRKKNRNKFGVSHKCLHKYQVNEKLQPVPRLANDQGESLCEICGGISKYLREHTVSEILARDPNLGGKNTPIVVVEMPPRDGRRGDFE